MTESAAGGPQHPVTVPITRGCRMSSTSDLQGNGTNPLAVSRSVIALSETCGSGKASRQDILAIDPAGQLLVHITGLDSFNPSLGLNGLVFRGAAFPGSGQVADYRYDLVTGTLARLSVDQKAAPLEYPQAAGDYVLWYAKTGGHLAEFTR